MTVSLCLRELSAPGRGAIRVLELVGPGALERVRARFPRSGSCQAGGSFRPVALRLADGTLLDEAMLVVHHAQRVELHVHGARALVERLAQELGLPVREIEACTLEERAAEHLAQARSEAAARMLLDQTCGALRSELEAMQAAGDEALVARARLLARRGRVGQRLMRPPRVVLAGPANAGKSTLFNVLVQHERVVVDPAAGTTRDAVCEPALLGDYLVELYDTAGERAPGEAHGADREGIGRAGELALEADLVLWLHPGQGRVPEPRPELRILRSRADEERSGASPWPPISALGQPEAACVQVEETLREALGLPARAHVAGAGVPFEPGWNEALATQAAGPLRASLEGWLGPRGGQLD